MARKSNKTSHVLHLLAGEEPVPETPEQPEEDAPKEPAEPETSTTNAEDSPDMPNISIVSTGNSEGDPLADLIKEQLEENFSEEILNPPSDSDASASDPVWDNPPNELPAAEEAIGTNESDEPNPHSEAADSLSFAPEANLEANPPTEAADIPTPLAEITDEDKNMQTAADNSDISSVSQTETDSEAADAIWEESPTETVTAEPTTPPEAAPQTKRPPLDKAHLDSALYPAEEEATHNYRFVNVMEYVIKDMVMDFMTKFDMCTCERCVVDTTALALTYCPAKYIVVDKHTVSPLLNYYSNRYVGDVTVELTKACILVKENPRH